MDEKTFVHSNLLRDVCYFENFGAKDTNGSLKDER